MVSRFAIIHFHHRPRVSPGAPPGISPLADFRSSAIRQPAYAARAGRTRAGVLPALATVFCIVTPPPFARITAAPARIRLQTYSNAKIRLSRFPKVGSVADPESTHHMTNSTHRAENHGQVCHVTSKYPAAPGARPLLASRSPNRPLPADQRNLPFFAPRCAHLWRPRTVRPPVDNTFTPKSRDMGPTESETPC